VRKTLSQEAGLGVWAVSMPIVALALVAAGRAQTVQPPTFASGVELVPVTVSVEASNGSYLSDLEASQFHIFEDGRPQPIALFDGGATPIDLLILLDTSDSMGAWLSTTKTAADSLVKALRPSDRASLMTFGERTVIVEPFTSDRQRLGTAIARLSNRGSTSLYDALYVALREFRPDRHTEVRRRAIVVFSDGDDTTSFTSFETLLDVARRAGVATYTIRIVSPWHAVDPVTTSAFELRQLAHDTGARAFTMQGAGELPAAYQSIARELAHQYVLGFVPSPGEGPSFRRVTVTVDAPRVQVRARAGYVASTERHE
jgi:VWFA-related protein